jgi:hypothetical protein
MNKLLLSTALMVLAGSTAAQSQTDESDEAKERVQYTLILPEEKTPELVKPEENNPFEAPVDGTKTDEGTSEENQVRDILLRLPAVGGASGPSGMRIMLGGMRLVTGAMVPPVLPDQQVQLKVKSITPAGIELIWVEKKPSGLAPKVLMIPMDGAAKVRYRLPTSGGTGNGATNTMGSIRRNGAPVLSPQWDTPPPSQLLPAPPAQAVAQRLEAEVKEGLPVINEPAPAQAVAQHLEPEVKRALPVVIEPAPVQAVAKRLEKEVKRGLPVIDEPAPAQAIAKRLEAEVKRGLPVIIEPTPAQAVAARLEAETKKGLPMTIDPIPANVAETVPPKSNAPEASILRMLFGNHTPPAAK